MVELIAHRAGNGPAATEAARGLADYLELDVHRHRGRLVVRHAKRIWGTSRLWERWYLLPRGTTVPVLEEALGWIGPEPGLWVDLKGGLARCLPAEVCRLVGAERSLTLSTKAWWLFGGRSGPLPARLFRSAGNRFELLLLRRLPSRVRLDGVVVHQRLLTARLVRTLARHHGLVVAWAVTDEDRARRLVAWGVGGLILDDPALLQALAQPPVRRRPGAG
ncbi:MAG: glycerophosphodiester phosphodiesterase [Nocardioides sp.]